MILPIVRYKDTGDATLGKLFIDGEFQCHTLEDQHRDKKVKGNTRIPAGSYRVELRYSPKFSPKYGHKMLWIKDVPGFEYILIHKGNTEADTAGCILVGSGVHGGTMLVGSKIAYDNLYEKVAKEINAGNPVWITVIDYDRT